MQLLALFSNSRFHAQIWQFSPKLKTLVVIPLFYTKNWHADLEFACKFCFLVQNIFSERPHYFPRCTGILVCCKLYSGNLSWKTTPDWPQRYGLSRQVVCATGSVILKRRSSCHKCVVFQDRWSPMAVVSQKRFHCILTFFYQRFFGRFWRAFLLFLGSSHHRLSSKSKSHNYFPPPPLTPHATVKSDAKSWLAISGIAGCLAPGELYIRW